MVSWPSDLGMDSYQLVYVLLSVLGEKLIFFGWAANILPKNLVIGKVTETEMIYLPKYTFSSTSI